MVGFCGFRIPGTSLIPVSIAPRILVLPRLLMALTPSRRRTSHLHCFHPPPQKKGPHQTHDAQKFEHLQEPATGFMKNKWSNLNTVWAGITYIANKNVNKHYQETLASAFFKKEHGIFLHSIISTFTFKIPLNSGFIAKSECLWKFHCSFIRIYTSARSIPTIMDAQKMFL